MDFFVSLLITFWALQNSLLALAFAVLDKDNLIPFFDFGLPKWPICEGNLSKGSPKTAFIEVIEFLDHFLADFPCKSGSKIAKKDQIIFVFFDSLLADFPCKSAI